jgi:hypothetical protein
MTRIFAIFFLLILLAGCAPGSVVKDVPTGTPAGDEVVMTLETGGGITGKTTTWTIYASGKITNGEGVTLDTSPKMVTALRADLITSGFNDQVKNMPRTSNCADCTTTSLTLTIDGKPVTLAVVNEAAETPASALSLVGKVTAFVTDLQGK